METIEHSLNGNPQFGRRSSVTITRNGDLITKVYLLVKLAKVVLSEGSKFAWVRRLGHALIHSVEVEIGGSRIDKHYGIWLDIWYELARQPGDIERGFAKMIGDVPDLTEYNGNEKPEYNLYIPLKFWFNRHVGLALPLIALQYHEVRLHFEFNDAANLIITNRAFKNSGDIKCVEMKDALLLVDYIYLDSEERRRFAQVGHEYLIEQLQFTGEESADSQAEKYKLDFNHPTKELIWAMRNGNFTTNKAFVCYTHENDWNKCGDCGILYKCALQILKCSLACLNAEMNGQDPSGDPCTVLEGEEPPTEGTWEEFCPMTSGPSGNGKINVINKSDDKALWLNTDSLKIGSYSLTDKIYADILVDENGDVKITNLKTDLTVRDISFPVECMEDTRYKCDSDVCVNQFHNFGVLIDGTGNPVEHALIQLNGHDRFDRREGAYFNYVQPDQHHTNTPADGINVYSFALHPEQHQPSGSANLSRIDNTQLNLWFADPTWKTGLPKLKFLNGDNRLYIFAFSYNVLRIMSGEFSKDVNTSYPIACNSNQPRVCGYLLDKSESHPRLNKCSIMTVASPTVLSTVWATLSNCGDSRESSSLSCGSDSSVAQKYELGYRKTLMIWVSAQPNCNFKYSAVQRLKVSGPKFGLRYSLVPEGDPGYQRWVGWHIAIRFFASFCLYHNLILYYLLSFNDMKI